jgi:hypothetical protein
MKRDFGPVHNPWSGTSFLGEFGPLGCCGRRGFVSALSLLMPVARSGCHRCTPGWSDRSRRMDCSAFAEAAGGP